MSDIPRATAEITQAGDEIVVTVAWDASVDRNRIQSWSLPGKHKALANRLKRAVDAQAVCVNPTVLTDTAGKTYVGSESSVVGRHMNADLRRLGY
jgi:hypothetical protein